MALTSKRDRATREADQQTTPAKDSPWGGLRSRFLASLDPGEQVRIFDLSARTSQTLHRWAARYPRGRAALLGGFAQSEAWLIASRAATQSTDNS